MSDERIKDGRSASPDAVTRRNLLKGAAALTVTGPALAALLSGDRRAYAQAIDCLGLPPEALEQDLTLTAAYAASPPALDEIAFTMETENLMALTYGGDLVQYRPIWYPDLKVCGAGVSLPGDEAVMGRWAESWKSSADGTVWTFRLKKGIKSYA